MATYEEIYGKRVKEFDSDPTLDSSYEGQVWYDKSTGVLKSVVSFDSWFSSSNMSVNRRLGGGFGTTSAAITFGGFPGNITATEEYNGSGWGSGGALNNGNARFSGSVGTLTAGLRAGGLGSPTVYVNNTEEYDGSSWTSVTAMPVSRGAGSIGGIGTQTAAIIAVGGSGIPTSVDAASLKYDGTNWTAGGSMNTGRLYTAGFGTQTAGLYAGGYVTAAVANVETYDGTSWSETTDISTARYSLSSSNNSPQTSGVIAGGDAVPGRTNATESWDGSSWTTRSTMGSARSTGTGAGTTANSMMTAGGVTPSTSPAPAGDATTEEFTTSINTITAAAWASGGNLNTGRELGGNAGTSTAGLLMAGKVYPNTFKSETEEYNGTSWSEQNNVSTARATSGAGTQTAGIIFGGTNGAPGSTGVQTATEEYDGSSWTAGGALTTARMGMYGAGLQGACFGAGGTNSSNSPVTTVEDYNGTSWTAGTAIPTAQQGGGGAGLPSARLVFAGYAPYANFTVEGDGEGWTAGGNMIDARGQLAGFGSQTDALACAGSTSPPNVDTTAVEGYDGTSWSTRPSLSTERMGLAPGGSYNTTTGGMVVGGSDSGNPMRNQTEEWSAETETVTAKTLTTS